MNNNIEKRDSFFAWPSGWTKTDIIAMIFALVVAAFVEWFWYTPMGESPALQQLGLLFVFGFAYWIMREIILKLSQTESK